VKKPEKQTIHCGKSHNLIDPRDCLYFYDADEIDTYLSSIADVERIKGAIQSINGDLRLVYIYKGQSGDPDLDLATAISDHIKGNK